ncbi:hypothetical protein VD0004_g9539 [Verticillium dahliae]|nr:hypothetical protein VD0004_g9539 [Verticillium dahliae]PNH74296.1 hypothetical protein VD0001_g3241 [Verticillium dahliae]
MHLFAAAAAALQARQTVDEDLPPSFDRDDDDYYHWWYSREGRIVKWSLFLAFFLLLMGYLIGGYLHAKRRLKKGLLPLAYHRWMVRRAVLAQVDPRYGRPHQQPAYYATYRPGYGEAYAHGHGHGHGHGGYGMQNMPPPPPMYDPSSARPPMYVPPEGGSKVDPSQTYGRESYAPPAGPPPPQQQQPQQPQQTGVATNTTGNTNPFLDRPQA